MLARDPPRPDSTRSAPRAAAHARTGARRPVTVCAGANDAATQTAAPAAVYMKTTGPARATEQTSDCSDTVISTSEGEKSQRQSVATESSGHQQAGAESLETSSRRASARSVRSSDPSSATIAASMSVSSLSAATAQPPPGGSSRAQTLCEAASEDPPVECTVWSTSAITIPAGSSVDVPLLVLEPSVCSFDFKSDMQIEFQLELADGRPEAAVAMYEDHGKGSFTIPTPGLLHATLGNTASLVTTATVACRVYVCPISQLLRAERHKRFLAIQVGPEANCTGTAGWLTAWPATCFPACAAPAASPRRVAVATGSRYILSVSTLCQAAINSASEELFVLEEEQVHAPCWTACFMNSRIDRIGVLVHALVDLFLRAACCELLAIVSARTRPCVCPMQSARRTEEQSLREIIAEMQSRLDEVTADMARTERRAALLREEVGRDRSQALAFLARICV
eukprot:5079249-Pleurochrysis_carterae.AAC.1